VPSPGGIYAVSGSAQQITTTANVQVITASADASGICELVGIANTGLLYHARQDAAGSLTWSDFVPIGAQADQAFVAIQSVRDPSGDMRILAVTTENELYQIWQDPDTSDWFFEEIEFSLPSAIQAFTSYRTQITFYDTNDAPAADVDVQISTDQPVTMAINGVMTGLSPTAPWNGTTDGSGRVVLSYMTGGIGVGALSVLEQFHGPGGQRCARSQWPDPIHARRAFFGWNQLDARTGLRRERRQHASIHGYASRGSEHIASRDPSDDTDWHRHARAYRHEVPSPE